MKKILVLAVIVFVMAIIVPACAAPTSAPAPTAAAPAAPAGVKVLRLARSTYPDVLDPQKSSYGIEIEMLKLCYEGLTAIDNKGNIGPGAADKYTLAPDGKSMVFHIREGLKRADGTPMNASDYEYALKREVDPFTLGKQYTDMVHDIKGADALIELEGKKPAQADVDKLYAAYGVKADDSKRELTVSFENPIGYWHYIAYTWVTYPTLKKAVDAAPDNWWAKPEGHACNGPFKVQSIEEGKRIVYVANANYWRGKPKLDRIEATYIVDEVQRFEAYKKGEFDEVDVTSATLSSVDDKLKPEFVRYAAANTTMLPAFNNSRKPFDDKNVRIAFSQAFDREGFIRDVQKNIGKAYLRWIPPGVPGAQPDAKGDYATDPVKAVQTLVKNGYGTADGKVDCAKLGELKISYASTAVNKLRFEFVAANFQKVFGCPIILDPVDSTVLTAMTKDVKTNPQMARQGWIQDYPHPNNWLSIYWKCAAFAKRYGYCNKDLDAQMAKADQTLDFAASLKEYQKAEDMLMNDLPGSPAYYNEALYLVKPYLIGLKENTGSSDLEWAGEWGPVWTYDVDLTKVPADYPKK
jgi:oligopeptide transport system substrate-binding protein